MNQDPNARASKLFDALRKLCGADDKQQAEQLLGICHTMKGVHEADQAAEALKVLIEEWPEAIDPEANFAMGVQPDAKDQISKALAEYHKELSARKYGAIAASDFVHKVEAILDQPWKQ